MKLVRFVAELEPLRHRWKIFIFDGLFAISRIQSTDNYACELTQGTYQLSCRETQRANRMDIKREGNLVGVIVSDGCKLSEWSKTWLFGSQYLIVRNSKPDCLCVNSRCDVRVDGRLVAVGIRSPWSYRKFRIRGVVNSDAVRVDWALILLLSAYIDRMTFSPNC